ncbi:MAG: hypothetical protein J0L92_18775, partial [Deltaproteobacteria bacterium]|nr:hypothetical protein [Deltaproteobacteria bacterium]
MSAIREWLEGAGLAKYAPRFEEEEITLEILPHLTETDLSGLGLPIGPRRTLLLAIERMRAGGDALSARPSSESGGRPPSRPGSVPGSLAPSSEPGARMSGAPRSTESAVRGPERRQLTVMFCDLVGSTALSVRMDAEELHALIQRYRAACGDVVVRYGGHVAQYLGDGLMAYFGWPVGHED